MSFEQLATIWEVETITHVHMGFKTKTLRDLLQREYYTLQWSKKVLQPLRKVEPISTFCNDCYSKFCNDFQNFNNRLALTHFATGPWLLKLSLCSFIFNNYYSPKWRWLAVDIYRAAERRGKYLTLVTDTVGDNCFSICPVSE